MRIKTIITLFAAAFLCSMNVNAQTEITPGTPQGELTPEQMKTREEQMKEAQAEKEKAAKILEEQKKKHFSWF